MNDTIHVYHVNAWLSGGAARAALRALASLRLCEEITTRFLYVDQHGGRPSDGVVRIGMRQYSKRRILPYIRYFIRSRATAWRAGAIKAGVKTTCEAFSPIASPIELYFPNDTPFVPERTILHLHWLGDFVDYETLLESVPASVPIVWTLHDMYPFTGGCHYSNDCRRFDSACGQCPYLEKPAPHDSSYQILRRKKQLLAGRKLHVVGNSNWTTAQARSSALFENAQSCQTIHYALDTSCFYPVEKSTAKKALGLAPDAVTVSFGADEACIERKGARQLAKALAILKSGGKDVTCLVFGNGAWRVAEEVQPSFALEKTRNDSLLRLVYSASDAFILPSLQEAFGQTALEAMACGTPVIGSDVGGIPDMVRHQQTGLLVPPGDADAIAAAMSELLGDRAAVTRFGSNCRKAVEEHFTLQRQASEYLTLYQEALQ